ncbi:unnamed protein product [Cylicocyclus nassatus]|uniref:Uncharacterized protein n=1 Tax=Cylicocyclus nassatus TaxID=53992 RepID=A0AA36GDQ1_CYLNA|nr:unnamed protein product [Cylicocyclus nassatus]
MKSFCDEIRNMVLFHRGLNALFSILSSKLVVRSRMVALEFLIEFVVLVDVRLRPMDDLTIFSLWWKMIKFLGFCTALFH